MDDDDDTSVSNNSRKREKQPTVDAKKIKQEKEEQLR
jgi:hypothetical protein